LNDSRHSRNGVWIGSESEEIPDDIFNLLRVANPSCKTESAIFCIVIGLITFTSP
jgi:hypothetical protein